jgi:hypothetical protein
MGRVYLYRGVSEINCGVCGNQKLNVESLRSKLTGVAILVCATCISAGFEPRELIIIAYHNEKLRPKAIKYIKTGKYLGPRIELSEVL